MKKILLLMLSLVASSASFATASIPPSAAHPTRLVMTAGHTLKLYVQPLQTNGQLAIWDAKGQAVYTTRVGLQKGLSQQFDFSSLGTGTYRLTLATGPATLTRTFVVQANPNESFVVQESL